MGGSYKDVDFNSSVKKKKKDLFHHFSCPQKTNLRVPCKWRYVQLSNVWRNLCVSGALDPLCSSQPWERRGHVNPVLPLHLGDVPTTQGPDPTKRESP